MPSRKLSVALAAVLLGLQFGSPSLAAVSPEDVEVMQDLILTGDVESLLAFLVAHPEFLELSGTLGDALRSFWAEPTAGSLLSVATLAEGGISMAMVGMPDAGITIY